MPSLGKAAHFAALLPLAAAVMSVSNSAPAAAQRHAVRHSPAIASSIAEFYRSRGGAPLWFSPTSVASVQNLMLLLSTAQADGLNPNRYNVRGLARVVRDARGVREQRP